MLKDHPLRRIKAVADAALARLSPAFDRMYAKVGRASVPPERLPTASLLIALYAVRSERAFCVELAYNLPFRWFLDMGLIERSFDATGVHQEPVVAAGARRTTRPGRRGGVGGRCGELAVARPSLQAGPTSSVRESERERIADAAWTFDTDRQRTVMMIVEAQSARQRHLAVRLLRYVVDRLLELCEDRQRHDPAGGMPPVVVAVLYTGPGTRGERLQATPTVVIL